MKKFKKIIPYCLLLIAIAMQVIVRTTRDALIQQNGIVSYNGTVKFVNILSILLFLSSLCLILIPLFKHRKEKIAKVIEQTEKEERQSKRSLSSTLDDIYVYEKLKSYLSGGWDVLSFQITSILEQLDEMNRHQNKLQKLLNNNGASYLDDSNDVLESVEQYLLRNVRKALNYLSVGEPTNPSDVEKISKLLNDIQVDNRIQLDNVKEFLFVTTDFLNQQGNDDTDIKKLNLYKETILESIKEDSIREQI